MYVIPAVLCTLYSVQYTEYHHLLMPVYVVYYTVYNEHNNTIVYNVYFKLASTGGYITLEGSGKFCVQELH